MGVIFLPLMWRCWTDLFAWPDIPEPDDKAPLARDEPEDGE